LIVEDDRDISKSLRDILELEGYRVTQAANGKEAMLKLHADQPGLILLDLMMPVMNGWQFLEANQGDDLLAVTPVIVVSAYGDRVRTSSRIKPLAVLKKPIDLNMLLALVAQHCARAND
jgi:DNA-binding response OmpR family regulator